MKFPPPITDEELTRLVPLMQKGDIHARNRCIEGHMGLVFAISKRFFCRKGTFTDYLGEAFLRLVKACTTFQHESQYLTPYIISCVKYAMIEYRIRDNLIYVPNEALDCVKEITEFEDELHAPEVFSYSPLELKEFISSFVTDTLDQEIIGLKVLTGKNSIELSKTLGIPDRSIREIFERAQIGYMVHVARMQD